MDEILSCPCIDSKNNCLFKVKVLIGFPLYQTSNRI